MTNQYVKNLDASNEKRLKELVQKFEDAGLSKYLVEFMHIKNFPFDAYQKRILNG